MSGRHWWRGLALAAALGSAAAEAAPPAAPTPSPSPALARSAKEAVLWQKLRARIEAADASLDGVLGVYVKDLKTGAILAVRADEPFPTASSIKLAVLYELFRQAEEGRLDLAEVTRSDRPRVGGGGVLQELGDHVSLSWRDVAVLMMGWSDNEATNLLIGKLGMEAVNARMRGLGLTAIHLRRRMMDVEAARRGDENVASPADLARLMEVLREGRGLAPERVKDLVALASMAKESPFRKPLPETVRVLDKPGELEGVRCVSALVDLPRRPYVAVVMTTALQRDGDGDKLIRDLSAALFETFDRLGRISPYGRLLEDR